MACCGRSPSNTEPSAVLIYRAVFDDGTTSPDFSTLAEAEAALNASTITGRVVAIRGVT